MKKCALLLLLPLLLASCSGSAVMEYESRIAELESRLDEAEHFNKLYKDRILSLDTELKEYKGTSSSSDILSDDANRAPETKPPETEPETEPQEQYYEPILGYSTSGSGDSVIESMYVSYPSFLHFKTYDDGHHDVKAYYGEGKYDYELLVNASDMYSGSSYLMGEREYDIIINSDGDWEIEVYQIGYTDDVFFVGSDDSVTDIFQPPTKYYTISYDGDDYFCVKQWYGLGEFDYELLANGTGPYTGTVRLAYSDSLCFFTVTGSEGVWSIKPSY